MHWVTERVAYGAGVDAAHAAVDYRL